MFSVDPSKHFSSQTNLAQYMPYDEVNGFDPLNSEFRRRLPDLPVAGRKVITAKYEYRAELLAYSLYGSTSYWWIILDYNGLDSPFQLKCGVEIQYPSKKAIQMLNATVSALGVQTIGGPSKVITSNKRWSFLGCTSPANGELYFESNSIEPKIIVLNPILIARDVTYELTNDYFIVDRVYKQGETFEWYYTVRPSNVNTPESGSEDATEDITGEIIFKWEDLSYTVNLLQWGETIKPDMTPSSDTALFDFNGNPKTKGDAISLSGFSGSLVLTPSTEWISAEDLGQGTFEISCTRNLGTSQRSGTVTATSGFGTVVINVVQDGQEPTVVLSKTVLNLTATASSNTVTVSFLNSLPKDSTAYEVSVLYPTGQTGWVTVTEDAQAGTLVSINIKVSSNVGSTSTDSRCATVVVSTAYASNSVAVIQAGNTV